MMRIGIRGGFLMLACSSFLAGCGSAQRQDPFAYDPPPIANGGAGAPSGGGPGVSALANGAAIHAEHTAPVVGGTLLVTADGKTIVAADPDRDLIFLVDAQSRAVRTITLAPGEEPGRVAEGAAGTVYVALRRAGALLAIDLAGGAITQRQAVCASPRGVAFDAAHALVYVACRSGQLLTLAASDLSRQRTLQLDTDLRDVVVREHDLIVTRFMSAEVMVVAEDGGVSRRATPDPEPGCGVATVAYRALALPNGQIALAHQASSTDVIADGPDAYGFSCGGGLVRRVISVVDADTPSTVGGGSDFSPGGASGQTESSMTIHSATLPAGGPLDVAIDRQGLRVASIALDNSLSGSHKIPSGDFENPNATLWLSPWSANVQPGTLDVGENVRGVLVPGQPVAVAFDAAGKYVVQSREPAKLEFENGGSVTLSADSRADTGHLMFNMDSGIGIACSSCHPEGGDDGHTWKFQEGFRRTMPLEGGVMNRAPFHWDGSLGDMTALVGEVMVERMGLPVAPNDAQIGALGSYLQQLPMLPAEDGLDAAAVARGKEQFFRADVGCITCHSGPQYTNNVLADVGTGGEFSTPTLLGVGLRPALFHDGCAKTIADRFGPCGGTKHGKPELLSADERADMIAFLRSL